MTEVRPLVPPRVEHGLIHVLVRVIRRIIRLVLVLVALRLSDEFVGVFLEGCGFLGAQDFFSRVLSCLGAVHKYLPEKKLRTPSALRPFYEWVDFVHDCLRKRHEDGQGYDNKVQPLVHIRDDFILRPLGIRVEF